MRADINSATKKKKILAYVESNLNTLIKYRMKEINVAYIYYNC